MWWTKSPKRKLADRVVPKDWKGMTLPDIAAYYSALDYNLAHAGGLSNLERQKLRGEIDKYRKFLARRAPAPAADWGAAAKQWNPLVSLDGMYAGGDAVARNIRNQAEGAVAREAKADLLAKVERRRRAQGHLW